MSGCRALAERLDAWLRRSDGPTIVRQGPGWAVDCLRADCAESLARLIEAGVDPEGRDTLDRTLLNWACQLGGERCIRTLLALGADPHGGSFHSMLMALGAGQDGAACILLKRIVPRTHSEEYLWACEAISHGCARTLAWFIERGYPLNRPAQGHTSLLEWAARSAGPDMLEQLVAAGAELDLPGYGQRTPLMAAIEAGRLANAHWLLDRGADPRKRTATGGPLDMLGSSLARDDADLVRRLQAGDGARAVDAYAIRAAAQGGRVESLRLLLPQAADIDAADAQGETALHKAARRGSAECLALLLQRGAQVDRRNGRGETALALLWRGHGERSACLRLLLERGADPRALATWIEPPCFVSQLAAAQGEVDLVAALQRQARQDFALDPDPVDWEAQRSAATLVAALLGKDTAAVQDWLAHDRLDPARLAHALRADPRRALFAAVEIDAGPVVERLLDGGVAVDSADGDNNTALNIAARHDRLAIARLLIARGADAQARTERGYAPIRFARSIAMQNLLRRHGG